MSDVKLNNGMIAVFDIRAIMLLEKETGLSGIKVVQGCMGEEASISNMVYVLHYALKRHQPDITLDESADLLSENFNAVITLLIGSLPDAKPEVGNEQKTKAK